MSKKGFFDGPRSYSRVDPYETPCDGCGRERTSVPGPLYPDGKRILCAECGAKVEAKHWNEVFTKRDGGST